MPRSSSPEACRARPRGLRVVHCGELRGLRLPPPTAVLLTQCQLDPVGAYRCWQGVMRRAVECRVDAALFEIMRVLTSGRAARNKRALAASA